MVGECRNKDAEIFISLMIKMQRLLELEWQISVKQNYKECNRTAAENGSSKKFAYNGSLIEYETPQVILYDIHHQILSLWKN